ncbi:MULTISPECIES: hypothetical protein [Pseudomonas fluorescens group]|uniref:Phage replication protein n=1 Tax=Pseudomonas azotoformans TaxID=47878 RepID=A0A4Q0HXW1_PSEAZ|nr:MULTISPECIES: hypothetical protein [Pseudomonas fluorescens group]RXE54195.1 hypothetical protein B4O85_04955 [Pseudomonas azotoformans]
MARARNIKPALFTNEILGVGHPLCTLLFQGLWLLADKEGRLEDRPLRIKAEIFPYREADVDAMLHWLAHKGFIVRYSASGKAFIEVCNFTKHQNPHKNEKESEIPSISEGCITSDFLGTRSEIIGTTRADSLSSDSDLLIPDSLIPDVLNPDSKPLPVAEAPAPSNVKVLKPKPKQKTEAQAANTNTWDSYTIAYLERYGVEPVRNAKVNGQVAQLVQRLGAEEAPGVAAFYVSINDSFFIRASHEFGLLVARAEGIRTQWLTGRQVNAVTARQMENTQANITAAQEASRSILEGGNSNAFLRRNR